MPNILVAAIYQNPKKLRGTNLGVKKIDDMYEVWHERGAQWLTMDKEELDEYIYLTNGSLQEFYDSSVRFAYYDDDEDPRDTIFGEFNTIYNEVVARLESRERFMLRIAFDIESDKVKGNVKVN